MSLHEIKQDNTTLWVPEHNLARFQSDWFDQIDIHLEDSQAWQAGRQTISRFSVGDKSMVIRHYCRGGIPVRLSKDRFIFCGYAKSRPYQEMNLLLKMRQLDLPVPDVIAARLIKYKLTYTADIMMSEIKDVETLAQIISRRELDQGQWLKIGETIRRFHDQGIQHVDLNANNILIDYQGNVYLIDFDRCVQRKYSQRWALAGLARLQRSLQKIKKVQEKFFFKEQDFQVLVKAYKA